MDQGLINVIKVKCRKKLVFMSINRGKHGKDTTVSVLDVIFLIVDEWNGVSGSTIGKQ